MTPRGSPFAHHVRQHGQAFGALPDYIQQTIVATCIRGAIERDLPLTDTP